MCSDWNNTHIPFSFALSASLCRAPVRRACFSCTQWRLKSCWSSARGRCCSPSLSLHFPRTPHWACWCWRCCGYPLHSYSGDFLFGPVVPRGFADVSIFAASSSWGTLWWCWSELQVCDRTQTLIPCKKLWCATPTILTSAPSGGK